MAKKKTKKKPTKRPELAGHDLLFEEAKYAIDLVHSDMSVGREQTLSAPVGLRRHVATLIENAKPDDELNAMLKTKDTTELQRRFQSLQGKASAKGREQKRSRDSGND